MAVAQTPSGWTAPGSLARLAGIAALIVIGLLIVQRVTDLPSANSDYALSVAPGLQPASEPARIAAVARHYLDQQTPELDGPHADPVVRRETAVLARDAATLEPGVPTDQVAAQPTRIVWVVAVSGDLLNLHDLPWSCAGYPLTQGNIVIDDRDQTVLGVYPHFPGEAVPTDGAVQPACSRR